MTEGIAAWVARYGYIGLGVTVLLESAGVPVPGETALLAAAFAAAHGALSLPIVMLVGAAAGMIGDNLGYAFGRRVGRPWLERFGSRFLLSPAQLARAETFFARWGGPAVALARFAPGVRVVAALVAGVSRMPWRGFVAYNALGAVAWAMLVGSLGYGAGHLWRVMGGLANGPTVTALVISVTVASSAWLLVGAARRAAAADLRWLLWRSVAIVGVSLASALVLAGVVENVQENNTGVIDDAVRRWVLAHRPPGFVQLSEIVSFLGSPVVLGSLTAIALFVLWRRRRRAAVPAAVVPLLAIGVIVSLKDAFARQRPPTAASLLDVTYSFPSGHTAGATAVLITLSWVLRRERLAPAWVLALAVLTALLVGLSRIVLDVHWASDVLAGWSVGLLVAVVGISLLERMRQDHHRQGK